MDIVNAKLDAALQHFPALLHKRTLLPVLLQVFLLTPTSPEYNHERQG